MVFETRCLCANLAPKFLNSSVDYKQNTPENWRSLIRLYDIHDYERLRQQLADQKKHVWDIDRDIPWELGVDTNRFFLPLDDDSVAFPGANPKQRRALSQLMGVIVNTTISEMEDVAHKIRDVAWRQVLDQYPVNPEMYHLGEQFFEEEAKHAQLFRRYNDLFCEASEVDPHDLAKIVPSAYGAMFQKAIRANANAGGHAFWWVVAVVEEVALLIYQNMYRHRRDMDPLFYQIHRKHFEEESRHTNYAFMMLELIRQKNKNALQKLHLKVDLIYSEVFSSYWVVSELSKIKEVKKLAHKNEFFATLASCLPLMEKLSKRELVSRLFLSAPYISLILNHNHHSLSKQSATKHGAWQFKHPRPVQLKTHLGEHDEDVSWIKQSS
jgi:hypothetical protein